MQAKFAPARYFTLATLLVLRFWATGQAQTSIRLGDIHGDDERLEQVLAQRSSLSVIDMPLNELVEKLSVQFRVPIALVAKKAGRGGCQLERARDQANRVGPAGVDPAAGLGRIGIGLHDSP